MGVSVWVDASAVLLMGWGSRCQLGRRENSSSG